MAGLPVAVDDPLYATAVDTALTVSSASSGVRNNDFDIEGDTLSISLVSGPANGTISLNTNGTFTYTPNTSFEGFDSFTYKANDGSLDSNVATGRIAVGGSFGVRTNSDDVSPTGLMHAGALTLSQPLTMGNGLVYQSSSVNPQPVIVVETSLLSSSSVPDSIDAELTFDGVSQGVKSYFTTSLTAGDALRFTLQADGSSLATGYYDYEVQLTAWFGSTPVTSTFSGSQAVVNRNSSPFGQGWWFSGLSELVADSSGALLVTSTGDSLWFASDGAGGYRKATGDPSYSTLVKNVDNTYTLTHKTGEDAILARRVC